MRAVRRLGEAGGLPPFPEVPRLSADELRRICPPGRAAGALVGGPFMLWLSGGAAGPGVAGAHVVALLPKGGSADPMDGRQVVLLPVVYRLWALARGRLMRDRLREARLLRRALARLQGLDLDMAHVDGEPLARLARSRSMLACGHVRAHARLLRGWPGGPALEPVGGLAPGCPAATHWLTLVASCEAAPAREAGAEPRDCVDDLVPVRAGRAPPIACGAAACWRWERTSPAHHAVGPQDHVRSQGPSAATVCRRLAVRALQARAG